MRIADVLRGKGTEVATVEPGASVAELLTLLAERNVGALPVLDGGALVGIVSERDVVRRLHARGPELSGHQNAASGSSMRLLSACSITRRCAVSNGSWVLAKNRATATLPS